MRTYLNAGLAIACLVAHAHGQPNATTAPALVSEWSVASDPVSIDIDGNDNAFVLHASGRVDRFDSSGRFLTYWGRNGPGNGVFSSPKAIAADRDNNLWIIDIGSIGPRVQKLDPNGNWLFTVPLAPSSSGRRWPKDLDIGTRNEVHILDESETEGRVVVLDTSGQLLRTWSVGVSLVNGIAIANDGTVLITQAHCDCVRRFSSDGAPLGIWESASTGLRIVWAIETSPTGDIFVGDWDRVVSVFGLDGNRQVSFGVHGNGAGQLSGSPPGIAFDAAGNVYVVDSTRSKVLVYGWETAVERKAWGQAKRLYR